MSKTSRVMALVPIALAVGAGAAFAHHGWGSYDASKTVTVTGPVVTSAYENPHATVTIKGEGGKTWTVTLAPTSRMTSRGATADMIATGKTLTAVGYASTANPDEMRAERIISGGKTIEMR